MLTETDTAEAEPSRRSRTAKNRTDERTRPRGGGLRAMFKSTLGLSWACTLFGLRQLAGVFTPGRAAARFDHVARAADAELDEPVRNYFRVGDRTQREVVNMLCGSFSPFNSRFSPL